jgi:hypothetical protein
MLCNFPYPTRPCIQRHSGSPRCGTHSRRQASSSCPGSIPVGTNVGRHMKPLSIVASATFFACNLVGLAQSAVPCGQTLASQLRPNATLSIHSIAAGIESVGRDQNTVRVSCSAEDMDSARQVQLQLTGTPREQSSRSQVPTSITATWPCASRCPGRRISASKWQQGISKSQE